MATILTPRAPDTLLGIFDIRR